MGGGIAAGGLSVTVVGAVSNDDEAVAAGLEMMSIGGGGVISGASGLKTLSGKSCSLPICPKK